MKYKIIGLLWLLCTAAEIQAQTIDLEFPYFAGQTYTFNIFQGDKAIALKADTIPQGGKVRILIPKEYEGYKGMAQWYLTNSKTRGGLDLVINSENFSVYCLDSIPNENSIVYKNTLENTRDKITYRQQQELFEKHDALLAAIRIYPETSKLHKLAAKEYSIVKQQYKDWAENLDQSVFYADKFTRIVNLTKGIGSNLTLEEQEKALDVNDYIVHQLDLEMLYTSGYWRGIINNWVQLQTQMIKDDGQLRIAILTLLDRMPSDRIYTAFVVNLTKELTKAGKDAVLDLVLPTIKNSQRLLNYDGVLGIYQRDLTGKAPDLIIVEHLGDPTEHNHKNTVLKTDALESAYSLIVFYTSGCGPCQQTMQGLMGNYEALKDKGVKIISFSADTEEQMFKNTAISFPWKDKYCDLEGIKGINFQNYAVIGTPTMYLLDEKGAIVKKMATVEELLDWSKEI